MKLFLILASIIMFSIFGFSSSAYSNSCGGLLGAFEQGEVFSGNVKSIEIEWFDKPARGDDGPTHYGIQHIIFDVHQFFKGTAFETIDYQTPIDSMDLSSSSYAYLEIGKEYLVIGYQHENTVRSNWCSGGDALEISDAIKNGEIYVKPIEFTELLTAIYDSGTIKRNSDDVGSLVKISKQMSQSPKIQLQSGIMPTKILCKEGLQLFFKNNYDSSPVCVKTSSVQKLIQRGWGTEKFTDNHPNNIIQITDSENYLKYRITDNSKITKVIQDKNNLIMIKINSVFEGNLTVELPRALIDSRKDYCPPKLDYIHDDIFLVLINSEEMLHDEVETTSETRTLSIPFPENTKEIMIIGTCLV